LFQNLIEKRLVNNKNRVVIIQTPDQSYEQQQIDLEKQLTASLDISPQLPPADTAPVSILPTLTVEDIPKEVHRVNVTQESTGLVRNSEKTNGIVYVTIHSVLEQDTDADLLVILAYAVSQIGTTTLNRTQLAIKKGLLGEIYASPRITSKPFQVGISVTSKCLEKDVKETIDLVKQMITETRWNDHATLKVLLDQMVVSLSEDITSSGNTYASLYASSALGNDFDIMRERLNGLSQVKFLKNLVDKHTTEEIAGMLKNLSTRLFKLYSVLVTSEKKPKIDLPVERNLNPTNTLDEKKLAPSLSYIPIPFPVNFVAMSIQTDLVQFRHDDHAHLMILASVLKPLLHASIREKGGAYGSSAAVNFNGVFVLSSYRDPQTLNTVSVYTESIKTVCSLTNITAVELQEAKLRVFQMNDRPDMPHDRAQTYFYFGVDDDKRQQYRTLLLKTELEDIQRVCNKYLLEHKTSSVAILGSKSNIPDAIATGNNWTIINDLI
jgi:Zn-dependent M16 (insulinase) family peptidase